MVASTHSPGIDRLALAEVSLFTAALLVLNWDAWRFRPALEDAVRLGAAAVALLTLIAAFLRRRPTHAGSGFSRASLGRGWREVALFTIGGVALLAVLGVVWGEPSLALVRGGWLRNYVLGVIGQQLVLQLFINDRFYRVVAGFSSAARGRFAAIASALLFAGLHAPNPWLMVVTLPAAWGWTTHFRRHFNLPALMASQFALGSAAMVLLGEGPLLHLRVGWGAMRMMLGSD